MMIHRDLFDVCVMKFIVIVMAETYVQNSNNPCPIIISSERMHVES
jgi:hypothetical protein